MASFDDDYLDDNSYSSGCLDDAITRTTNLGPKIARNLGQAKGGGAAEDGDSSTGAAVGAGIAVSGRIGWDFDQATTY